MSGVRGMDLSDLLQLAIAAKLAALHVAFPARVVAYDATHNTVDVEPAVSRTTKTLEGSLLVEDLPIVCGVPIAWQRTGGFGVTFPLEVDDTVLVVVCDRNHGEWRRTGRRGDPLDAGVHGLDGAVAIPGLYPRAGALGVEHVPAEGIRLGSLATNGPYLHVTAGSVEIKSPTSGIRIVLSDSFDRVQIDSGGTTDLVALAGKVFDELTKIASTLATGTAGGDASVWGTPYTTPLSVAASKLRAE